MVSGSSVPPPVASPRMRAAPRRKRGRTGAVLRTAAPEVCGRTAPCRGEKPSAARIPPPSPPLPSAPLRRGMRGFGTAEGLGAPTAAALLPASGPGPPEPPALLPVPPGAEAGAGQRYCSSSGSFAAQLGSRRCGCERRSRLLGRPPVLPLAVPLPQPGFPLHSSTALRAAAKLLPDCCGVTSLSSSLTGPPSPSQDPHSPLMRNPAAIHISGWGSSCAPMPALKRGE
ncbi:wiskott-Aldrich syndrome protein family member 1-like isoform X2 [Gallus gallus]|uniref:wiskott-Aldrich syndrome protein family member 1-like isoform X2 n=1 Tax=Gallus gallus TaxID=9031 RepID=UPI001AE6FDD5|nr:wiskott-Aldrich syndrome protein family member 1-like isoform X2 [Gallus gallus]